MFILSCPTCGSQRRVRFARSGATATCPDCHTLFDVNDDTLEVEDQTVGEPEPAQPAGDADPLDPVAHELKVAAERAEETPHWAKPKRHDPSRAKKKRKAKAKAEAKKKTKPANRLPLMIVGGLILIAVVAVASLWLTSGRDGNAPFDENRVEQSPLGDAESIWDPLKNQSNDKSNP